MTYIADTHVIVWFLEDDPRLSKAASDALDDANAQLVIPTIVLAEIAFLYARHRITIDLPQVFSYIANAMNCVVYPLDEFVIRQLPTTLDIHDAIIVATAIMFRNELGEDTALITKDAEIVASGMVRVIW